MRVRTKICGLSTVETLNAAVRHGAAAIGMVFFPPSPRHLELDQAAALAAHVPEGIARVGVFVDPEDGLIDQAVEAGRLDVLQLHRVGPARAASLRARTGLPVWAAVAIRTDADLAAARTFIDAADRLLYDAKTPEGAALPGGMGMRFDWGLLRGFHHPLPWVLSGGLTSGNVAEAVAATQTRFVDVSSGVESSPGVKEIDKIAAFCKAVAAC